MKLLNLVLKGFKGFQDLEINFISDEDGVEGCNRMFLLGENGSGKTSVFEAIMIIFGGFYRPQLMRNYRFEYKICYMLNDKKIELQRKQPTNSEEYVYYLKYSGESKGFNEFEDLRKEVLSKEDDIIPKKIVTSYSGINDRLKQIHSGIETIYKHKSTSALRDITGISYHIKEIADRKFLHSDNENTYFYLPLLWLSDYEIAQLLNEYCGIDKLKKIRARIMLNIQNLNKILSDFSSDSYVKYRKALRAEYRHYGESVDELNRGYYINKSIDILKGILPNGTDMVPEYSQKLTTSDSILIEIDPNRKNFDGIQIFEFLVWLQSQFQASVEILIEKNHIDILATELSEGECQLIKVLGMLILTKETNSLVLLDEPDAHLNPKWRYGFREILDIVLSKLDHIQVIINTHDPLLINGAEAKEVRVLYRDKYLNKISAEIPYYDAIGRSVDGLLQSQYFNLENTLDYKTRSKMRRREELNIRYKENNINKKELEELNSLNRDIDKLPFTTHHVDKRHEIVASVMKEYAMGIDLTKVDSKELERRNKKIREIVLREFLK